MKYDWILFDADETLFHFDAFEGLQRLFSGYGVAFSHDDYVAYQAINKPLWVGYQDGKISAQTLQVTRFEYWATRLSVPAQQLNDGFLQAMADICRPLPGAVPLLDALKGRAKMGIITNGFTALQKIRLERTGLLDHFDLLVVSEQVGVAKPDRAIFDYAFARMQQPNRQRVLMVGDNPHSDILGGQQFGIDTCWYNATQADCPEGIEPSVQVGSLAELQQWLVPAADQPSS